jgi:hypothetical protein
MSSVDDPRRNARKRNPSATRRRALELLAASRDGCTEALMLAHGFTIEPMVELIRAGLATAKAERVVAGNRTLTPKTSILGCQNFVKARHNISTDRVAIQRTRIDRKSLSFNAHDC